MYMVESVLSNAYKFEIIYSIILSTIEDNVLRYSLNPYTNREAKLEIVILWVLVYLQMKSSQIIK